MDQGTHEWLGSKEPRSALSWRFVVVVTIFAVIVTILLYIPAIAYYQLNWLNDRLAAAHTGGVAIAVEPYRALPDSVRRKVLDSIGVRSISLKVGQSPQLLILSDTRAVADRHIDLRRVSAARAVVDVFETLFLRSDENLISVAGAAPMGGDVIEIVLEEGPLRRALFVFAVQILMASFLVAGITAIIMVVAINLLLSRPSRLIAWQQAEKDKLDSGARYS